MRERGTCADNPGKATERCRLYACTWCDKAHDDSHPAHARRKTVVLFSDRRVSAAAPPLGCVADAAEQTSALLRNASALGEVVFGVVLRLLPQGPQAGGPAAAEKPVLLPPHGDTG